MILFPNRPKESRYSKKGSPRYKTRARNSTSRSRNRPTAKTKQDENRITINLSHSRYPIIKKIAQEDFKMVISKNPSSENWDIYWSDTVRSSLTHARISSMGAKRGWNCTKR